MKRILLILHLPPPIHGASVISATVKDIIENVKNYNTKTIRINSSSNLSEVSNFSFKKILLSVGLLFKILIQLIIFRPQIIYLTASCNGFAFYRDFLINILFILFSSNKTKIHYHLHNRGVVPFTIDNGRIKQILIRRFFKNRNIILLSPSLKTDFDKFTLQKVTYSYLPNATSDYLQSDINTIFEKRYNNINLINVLFLSNMIKTKGYEIILTIIKELKLSNDIHKYHFHFAGAWKDGNDENNFNKFINEHSLENCLTFHGFCDVEKKKNLLTKCHCLLFPTYYYNEAFPLVIPEAFSFGLPVLASRIGAIPDILYKNFGLSLEIKEINKNSFISFCDIYVNKETAIMCRNAYLENYTIKQFEKKLLNILSNA